MTSQSQSKETVFISYAHESEAFCADVKALAEWLKTQGVTVVSDHPYAIRPPELGWQAWMQREVKNAAAVLVVGSPLYKKRFEKEEEPDRGLGATFEGAIITQELYRAAFRNRKFYPILPDNGDHDDVPTVLQSYHNDHRFPSGNEGILALVREVLEEHGVSITPAATTESSTTIAPKKRKDSPCASLPDIWNVPHRRNPNFTGREALLAQLERDLKSGKPAALTQALAGLGGVGKTQTALEYAYRHAADYEAVWWIRSEESATLAADFASLARKLNLPEKDAQEQEVIVEAVRAWLDAHRGWLLIFDNAVAPEDIRPYLPKNASGHVIITSRNQVFGEDAAILSVHEWKRPESVAFLAKRTKRNDPDGADAVADKLGDLPLALAQAAAYMEATGASYAGYLELFRKQHGNLWKNEPPPKDYPATVATTWKLSMEEAAKAAPGATELMNLCAYLAPDDIPRDMLRDGRKHVPEPLGALLGDELQINAVLAALRRFSLLEVHDDAFDMHRLVQAVVQHRLDPEDRKAWCVAAARIVCDFYPFESDDVTTWPICARLTPHARILAEHAEAIDVAKFEAQHLLNQVGGYLKGRAEFGEARAFLERALVMAEEVYGPNHPEVAPIVCNLGVVLQDLGDLQGARPYSERALVMAEKVYGPNHPNVAVCVNNLGRVLQGLGDLDGARAHYERALRIDEAAYGVDSPKVTIRLSNLATVLRELGDLAGARARLERALAIDEAANGPDHMNVARDLNNLGTVLYELGDLPGAWTCFDRALTIFRGFLHDSHPSIVLAAKNLAALEKEMGGAAE